MTAIILAALAIAAALTWALLGARRRYAPLFEDAHFRELVALLPRLKSAAFNRLGQGIQGADDPRVANTSAMVTVLYTAQEIADGKFVLIHLSLSRAGYNLTWAAGGRLAFVILRGLGVAPDQGAFAFSPAGIVHIAFVVPSKDRERFENASIDALPPDLTVMKEEAGAFMSASLRNGRLLRDEGQLVHHLLGSA